MYDTIAITTNEDHKTVALEACERILLYRNNGSWQLDREIICRLFSVAGIDEIRDGIRRLIMQLEDCKVIVSGKITGVSYHIFDKMGFQIFETDEEPSQALFDDIIKEIKEAEEKAEAELVPKSPVSPENDGNYILDLIRLQQVHPEISSKKALKQFMEEACFNRLEVICSHVPPWIETVIALRNFKYQLDKVDENACKLTVSPY